MAVCLSDEADTKLTLRFRVFDDGVGFRYEYEVAGVDSIFVTDELTSFNMAQDGISWSIPANYETYELLYRTQPLSKTDNANTPMTFKVGKTYASIHEAALTDFPEMTLQNTGGCGFKSELAPWPDGIKAKIEGGSFNTPWRTVQIASKAVGLINSALILNLNEPCVLESTDWIRPMKYVGIWWGMHLGVESWVINDRHGATTENAKRYIDFAAANNIEAVMFEGWNEGWENWGGTQNFDYTKPYADFDIKEIAAYARKKGVEIIGHHETGGNICNYENQLDKAYEWYADLGIHSVKTGYAGGLPNGHNHHGQFNVRHYRNVVKTAAKYRTTLDVHEPIKDTGIRRTYPNMMTREGARGMEWNAWSEGNPPEHHVMLGIHSVKTGYAGGLPNGHNHHGQFNVRHYRNVVKTAAKYRTTLDVHEPIKDTGIRRTYPNMMTREGARGMEWNAWSEGNPPEHHVMLPFTRLLGGPMDYTPGIFDVLYKRAKNNPDRKKWNMKDSKDCRINTTLAKQIANWVILYSPLQMAADMIENYEGHPAFRFFRDFDADCDWSEALAGEPGEYVAIVRKAKDKYFLGAATDEEARSIDVKLDFLEKGKTYAAVIYADGKDADWETNPESYEIIEKQVTSDDTLTIVMAKGGGQAVSFMPI